MPEHIASIVVAKPRFREPSNNVPNFRLQLSATCKYFPLRTRFMIVTFFICVNCGVFQCESKYNTDVKKICGLCPVLCLTGNSSKLQVDGSFQRNVNQ